MSATGLEVFDKTLQTTNIWLRDIMERLGPDRQLAWKVLSVVLHKLRDRLPLALSAHLGAELPILVRGIYYESWTPSQDAASSGEGFLSDVAEALQRTEGLEADPEQVTRGVLRVLGRRIPKPELERIAQASPPSIRELLAS